MLYLHLILSQINKNTLVIWNLKKRVNEIGYCLGYFLKLENNLKKKKLGPSQSYRVHTLLKTLLCDKLKKTGALKEVLVCNERDVCVLQAKPN